MRLANGFSIRSWPPAKRAAGSKPGGPNGPIPPMSWRPSVPSIGWNVCWKPCIMPSTNSAPPTPPGCSSTCRWPGIHATASVRTRRACRRTPASAKRSPARSASTAINSWTRCGLARARRISVSFPPWRHSGRSGCNNIIAVPSQGEKRCAGAPRRSNRLRPCVSPRLTSSRPAPARNATRHGWAISCTSARPVSPSTPI